MNQRDTQRPLRVFPKSMTDLSKGRLEEKDAVIQSIESYPSIFDFSKITGGTVTQPKPSNGNGHVTSTDAPSSPLTASPIPPPKTSQWNQSLQAVLDQPPATFPKQVMIAGFVFACVFSGWAWLGKIQEVRYAQGRLVPQGEVYKVQSVVEGKVATIRVQEGEKVRAQQVLAELDTQIDDTQVERLEQNLASYQLELSQTHDLIAKTVADSRNQATIAQAEIDTQQFAILQSQGNIDTQQKVLGKLEEDATAYQARLDRFKPLIAEGAIAREHIFEVEQAMRDRQRSIVESQGNVQKSQGELHQLQSQLTKKEAQKEQAELETQQQLQQLRLKATELQGKISETSSLLKEAKTRLDQRFFKAPISGIVSSLNIKNIGEVTQAGQTIVEIAPTKVPLIISAVLPSQEAGFVKVGMLVNTKLDAFPYQDYGTIAGKVISVSPDAKLDEKMGPVYKVNISLDKNYVVHEHQKIPFKAGQTANVEIVVRQRRIADVLLDPIRKLQRDRITL